MNRADGLARLAAERFDVLIVGGGATGLGAAVDAAARGFRTGLIEAEDFASATSSRSTKLIHGGVRYLQQGDIGLVREALHERTTLLRNAPHLVRDRAFVVPAYRWFELPYYGAGLAAYDLLAGWGNAFGRSRIVGPRAAQALIPGLRGAGLHGAIVYHDGQFDDARLAVTLARTAVDQGAAVANYVRATSFVYDGPRIAGVRAHEREGGAEFTIGARVVVNATGIFVDDLRRLDAPQAPALLAQSRGSHIVVHAAALGDAQAGLLVPRTPDGRVLFALPWHEHVLIGTTDIAVAGPELDPQPTGAEIAYLLETVNRYLARPLGESDILAAWAGLRPLVNRRATRTAALSREHLIDVAPSGLVTIAGGKWTTYRKMAADVVDAAMRVGELPPTPPATEHLPLHGARDVGALDERLRVYGTDAEAVLALERDDPSLAAPLDPRLPYTGAQVVYGARNEMAQTVDDVLARRTRALFLDAAGARASAPAVAALLAAELGRDAAWQRDQLNAFDALALRPPAPAAP
ncbi:MAG: glycerol-3-phosphate dehydrogenase/oxidase [Vulcanimicrobiaceae bacterium]